MLHFSKLKITAITAVVVIAFIYALPNFLPQGGRDFMGHYFKAKPVTLGLDLQGGSNVVLEIDNDDLHRSLLDQTASDIRSTLRNAKIGYKDVQRTPNSVSVTVTKPEQVEEARTALQPLRQQVGGSLFGNAGADLFTISGTDGHFTLTLSEAGYKTKVSQAITQSIKIVERRVNELGVVEPTIQQQGPSRISVQMPGIQNPQQLKEVIGKTAKLSFQLLCNEQPSAIGTQQSPPPECRSLPVKPGEESSGNSTIWVQTSSAATVDGGQLTSAQPSFDSQTGQPVVTFKFNQQGSFKFGKLTSENVGKPFAIILDDVVQSYPRINTPITGGSGEISGRYTQQQASDLALILRSGALPAKLDIVEERTVGPSLGADSIRAGLVASFIGLAGVLLFMVLVYLLFGVFANLALLANLSMLLAIMSVFGFTLTLPGIAGIVLTMGMAVDSNVLVYERIREEWRSGRSVMSALDVGFRQSFITILDANVTTLIAALVLFGVGSGPVRGFAITLAVGIATTVFTAYTLTRLIVALWLKYAKPKTIPL